MNKFKNPYVYKPFLAGLLLGISRLPLGLGFLVFFAFIPIISLLKSEISYRQLVKSSVILSFVYTAICLHWISLVTFPGLIGIFIVVSLYFYIIFALLKLIKANIPKFFFLSLLFIWISFEYLQNFGEFGFPWFNLAYSLSDYNFLIQPAEIGGIHLISGLILLVNIFLYGMWKNYYRNLIFLILLMAIWIAFGIYRMQTLPLTNHPQKVSIVQVSIPQNKKWDSDYENETLELYKEYTQRAASHKPSLIIWPESAIPGYVYRHYKYRNFVRNQAIEHDTNIFLGFPDYRKADPSHPKPYKHFNSCTQVNKNGEFSDIYDKNILVPFGERIPLLKIFPFLWDVHLGQANWEYGEGPKFYQIDDFTYSPLICFEIAFPVLTKSIAKQEPDFLVNITNDAWFYRSAGTYQHAVMAKFRAVETRLQIFRAANTGYSLIVSPAGTILKQSELFEKTILTHNIITYDNKTIFTKYLSWFPLVFVAGAAILLLIIVLRIVVKLL
ncbi:MAG: apolipoprotein N-acyltransferase [Candidatus Cloacimonadota bacterium]|nr:apolipoprotein N-acyltransferase [Candidatus Cloacimonadota bacterium]